MVLLNVLTFGQWDNHFFWTLSELKKASFTATSITATEHQWSHSDDQVPYKVMPSLQFNKMVPCALTTFKQDLLEVLNATKKANKGTHRSHTDLILIVDRQCKKVKRQYKFIIWNRILRPLSTQVLYHNSSPPPNPHSSPPP